MQKQLKQVQDAIKARQDELNRQLEEESIRKKEEVELLAEYLKAKKLIEENTINIPDNLSSESAACIISYTGKRANLIINKYLWSDNNKSEFINEYCKSLNVALIALPDYKDVTYRGTYFNADYQALFKVGNIISLKGFTSSTKNKNITKLFSNDWTLTIKGKHGKDISALSQSPEEEEVLFKHHTVFKILKVDFPNHLLSLMEI